MGPSATGWHASARVGTGRPGGTGTRDITEILGDPTVRTRIWLTAGLLCLTGLLALAHLVRSTSDMAGTWATG